MSTERFTPTHNTTINTPMTASAGPLAQNRVPLPNSGFELSRMQGFLDGREDIFDVLERHSANVNADRPQKHASSTKNDPAPTHSHKSTKPANTLNRITDTLLKGLHSWIL